MNNNAIYPEGSKATMGGGQNFSGRMTNEMFQRSGEMRLVTIACLIYSIEDRYTLFKKYRRIAGAFDLPDRSLGQPRGTQETILNSA